MKFLRLELKIVALVSLLICVLNACENKGNKIKKSLSNTTAASVKADTTSIVPIQKVQSPILKSALRPGTNLSLKKAYTDSLEFVETDDNGDYPLIFLKRGKETISMIYDQSKNINFLRGDLLEVKWKMDSLWIAGDGDKLDFGEWVLHIKKIKDGSVSTFRKKHRKPLKFWWAKEESYTEDYKDYLYKIVEYYLSISKAPLVQENLKDPDIELTYSIEDGEKNGRSYTVLGISKNTPEQMNVFQWLYVDVENHTLYEYDLANDNLNMVF